MSNWETTLVHKVQAWLEFHSFSLGHDLNTKLSWVTKWELIFHSRAALDLLRHGHIYKSWVNTKLYLEVPVTIRVNTKLEPCQPEAPGSLAFYGTWGPPETLDRAPQELESPLTRPPRAAGPRILAIT